MPAPEDPSMHIAAAPIHASLAVSDLDRSREWWASKLGWETVMEFPGVLVYNIGDSSFTLFTTPFAGTAKNTVMNWNVEDLAGVVEELKGRGVMFEDYDFGEFRTENGIMTDPVGGKTAWFKDPDGNIVGVLQAPQGQGSGHTLSVMLAASDLGRAKAWYADKLGFQPNAEFGDIVMDYTSGSTAFNVYRTEFAGSAKNTVAMWRLQGIREEVARLRERGVVFDEYDLGEWGKTVDGILTDESGDANAWFHDSEGNILGLAEDRGEGPG
ncbi:MAG TPA: VOC family protein [Candidatus Limnocylindrales bacterium]|nr:VOC family protein [Candidatus Limnocylindrales bacterium]